MPEWCHSSRGIAEVEDQVYFKKYYWVSIMGQGTENSHSR